MRFVYALLCLIGIIGSTHAQAQANVAKSSTAISMKESTKAASDRRLLLTPVETIEMPSEPAGMFENPLKCDADGNLYLKTETDGPTGFRKINLKAKKTILFQASSAPSDLGKLDLSTYFSVAADGDVYQLVYPHQITRYVFVYKSDGSYKSNIKLDPGFSWSTAQLAVFSSGDLLVTGTEYDRDPESPKIPFTGVFASDGRLLKEVSLKDDQVIHDLAAAGDRRVTSPEYAAGNRAVDLGEVESAEDGNVYLMRRISPAIVYAISPGGAVVRRFVVDPGEKSLVPTSMHIAGRRIALQFFEPQTSRQIIKVVDLEGHALATYGEAMADGYPALGLALACYSVNPERFTFLTTMKDDTLGVAIAEPR